MENSSAYFSAINYPIKCDWIFSSTNNSTTNLLLNPDIWTRERNLTKICYLPGQFWENRTSTDHEGNRCRVIAKLVVFLRNIRHWHYLQRGHVYVLWRTVAGRGGCLQTANCLLWHNAVCSVTTRHRPRQARSRPHALRPPNTSLLRLFNCKLFCEFQV